MTITETSVKSINTALLQMQSEIDSCVSSSDLEELAEKVEKLSGDDGTAALTEGATYNINISGTASSATYATSAGSTTYADSAGKASSASEADTADYATSAGTATTATTAEALAAGGTSGQVLTSNGTSAAPTWQSLSSKQMGAWTCLYSNSSGTTSSFTLSDDLTNYSEVCIAVKRVSDSAYWKAYTMPVDLLVTESAVFSTYGHMCSVWTDAYTSLRYTGGTTMYVTGSTSASVIAVYAR